MHGDAGQPCGKAVGLAMGQLVGVSSLGHALRLVRFWLKLSVGLGLTLWHLVDRGGGQCPRAGFGFSGTHKGEGRRDAHRRANTSPGKGQVSWSTEGGAGTELLQGP